MSFKLLDWKSHETSHSHTDTATRVREHEHSVKIQCFWLRERPELTIQWINDEIRRELRSKVHIYVFFLSNSIYCLHVRNATWILELILKNSVKVTGKTINDKYMLCSDSVMEDVRLLPRTDDAGPAGAAK